MPRNTVPTIKILRKLTLDLMPGELLWQFPTTGHVAAFKEWWDEIGKGLYVKWLKENE